MYTISHRTILAVLVLLSVAAVGQNAWYWTQMPENPKARIGTDGLPHTPLDRTSATLLMLAVQIGLPWILAAFARGENVFFSVNIPNREYWLTGDRRDASLAFVQKLMATSAIGILLYLTAINHLIFLDSAGGDAFQKWSLALHALFAIGLILAILVTLERFRIQKTDASN